MKSEGPIQCVVFKPRGKETKKRESKKRDTERDRVNKVKKKKEEQQS